MFKENKNTMVLTTKGIVYNKNDILTVYHDEEDGMWQFLDNDFTEIDNAILISLEEVLEIDYTLNEIYDLKLGWVAWRESRNDKWKVQKSEE